jgi:alginate O-acetyltransferase complex protein AlgI
MPYSEITVVTAWLGIIAYSFQIYFDFSGYSDMAIGLGKIFGFNFPENFNYPYISKSITEFWRRWHISLGSWFREYVYIPLGGNKGGSIKFYKNLFIVWFLTGLWHGPSWNFVLWGIYFGTIIAIEKSVLSTWLEKSPKPIAHLYTIVLIIFGWVLFYFDNLSQGIEFLKIMLGFSHTYFISAHSLYYLYNYLILLIILCISSTPVVARLSRELIKKNRRLYFTLSIIFYVGVLVFSTAYLVDDTYNPFLYFRF